MTFVGFTEGGTELPSLRDDFNRADSGTPGSLWTEPLFTGEGGVNIVSNQLSVGIADGRAEAGCYWDSDDGADTAGCFTIAAMSATVNAVISAWVRIPSAVLPLVGGQAAEDFYRIRANRVSGNDTITVDEWVNGTSTTLTPSSGGTSIGGEWTSGDRLGWTIRETGGQTEIVVWYRPVAGTWTKIGTYLSSTADRGTTGGRLGVEMYDNDFSDTSRIDDVYIEDYNPNFLPEKQTYYRQRRVMVQR